MKISCLFGDDKQIYGWLFGWSNGFHQNGMACNIKTRNGDQQFGQITCRVNVLVYRSCFDLEIDVDLMHIFSL